MRSTECKALRENEVFTFIPGFQTRDFPVHVDNTRHTALINKSAVVSTALFRSATSNTAGRSYIERPTHLYTSDSKCLQSECS